MWEKRTLIGACQVDEKELVVYGHTNGHNRTIILRMDDKEQNFQLSSVTISKEVPTLAGFKNAAVISSKNDLHIFDQNYDLWRYQRDWQTILKVDLSTHGLKFDRKKAPAN